MGWFGELLGDVGSKAVDGTVGLATGIYDVANTATFGFLGDFSRGIADTAKKAPAVLQWGGEQGGDVAGMNAAAYAQEDVNKQQQNAQAAFAGNEVNRANQRTNTALTQAANRNNTSAGSAGTF